MVDLSCIIVSWNSVEYLPECVASLPEAMGALSYEVILVDNASTDGTAHRVREDFPFIHLIENRENVGYSKANNQGIARCKGDAIFLLNPDTCAAKGSIEKMVEYLRAHPDVGVVGARLFYPGNGYQRCAAGHFLNLKTAFIEYSGLFFFSPKKSPWRGFILCNDHRQVMDVDWVSGAAMLVRRAAYEEAGKMNEDFFLYGEDVEWCWRIKRAGWRVRYLPSANVGHYSGRSIKKQDEKLLMQTARWLENLKKASNSRTPLWALKAILLAGIAGRLFSHTLVFCVTRDRLQWEHAKASWKMIFTLK